MSWTSLPAGNAVSLVAGYWYAIVAIVKSSHSTTDIKNLAAQDGLELYTLTDPADVPGKSPPSGYRYVAAQARATKAGSIPWAVPWWVPGDSSTMLEAWASPPNPHAPALPPPTADAAPVWPWLLGLGLAGGAGYLWWRWRSKR